MKLIALTCLIRSGGVCNPGDAFEVSDEQAPGFLAAGLAREAKPGETKAPAKQAKLEGEAKQRAARKRKELRKEERQVEPKE